MEGERVMVFLLFLLYAFLSAAGNIRLNMKSYQKLDQYLSLCERAKK